MHAKAFCNCFECHIPYTFAGSFLDETGTHFLFPIFVQSVSLECELNTLEGCESTVGGKTSYVLEQALLEPVTNLMEGGLPYQAHPVPR
jgi:hypothetical protein